MHSRMLSEQFLDNIWSYEICQVCRLSVCQSSRSFLGFLACGVQIWEKGPKIRFSAIFSINHRVLPTVGTGGSPCRPHPPWNFLKLPVPLVPPPCWNFFLRGYPPCQCEKIFQPGGTRRGQAREWWKFLKFLKFFHKMAKIWKSKNFENFARYARGSRRDPMENPESLDHDEKMEPVPQFGLEPWFFVSCCLSSTFSLSSFCLL